MPIRRRAAFAVAHADAQVLYGSIVGTVVDATKAPVAEASVEVTNAGTAFMQITSTLGTGREGIERACPAAGA
jgi:hypothetical protein